jgi:hypothetical protein
MPGFRYPPPAVMKEHFLSRVRGLDQLNPADRCYAIRGLVRESWQIPECDVSDVFRSAWGDATGGQHWKKWLSEGVCRIGDFAEMVAVLGAESAVNAVRRKIAILCCLRNGVEAGKIRITTGNPAALLAITERTHPAATAVFQGSQAIDLNTAKLMMDQAADWLVASCNHLLPESLLRYLSNKDGNTVARTGSSRPSSRNRQTNVPSVATVKRLFARSGNMCAFPGCSSALTQDDVIVGEICHIMKSVFCLAARRHKVASGALAVGSALVSKKRIGLNRAPMPPMGIVSPRFGTVPFRLGLTVSFKCFDRRGEVCVEMPGRRVTRLAGADSVSRWNCGERKTRVPRERSAAVVDVALPHCLERW